MIKLTKDPITITLIAQNAYDAEAVNSLYQDLVEKLPDIFQCPGWLKTITRFPVELYLIFPNKRKYNRFIKDILTRYRYESDFRIISKYEGRN